MVVLLFLLCLWELGSSILGAAQLVSLENGLSVLMAIFYVSLFVLLLKEKTNLDDVWAY